MLTYERASYLFKYEQETGLLFWKNKPAPRSNRIKIGDEVGNIFCNGKYRQCSVDKKKYLIHRVIWLLYYKSFPSGEIDHIDGNGLNNRIENLRDVSASVNMHNRKKRVDNKSGVTGVSWSKKARKWVVQTQHNGRNHYFGLFSSFDDAKKKREEVNDLFNFHKNHGKR